MQTLGLEMHSATIALRGRMNEAEAVILARMVIEEIGMTYKWRDKEGLPHRLEHKIWDYPVNEKGDGGVGSTTMQPCFTLVQPLLESYVSLVPGVIGVDTWMEFDTFYLIINSCRSFRLQRLLRLLKQRGWSVLDYSYSYCSSLGKKPRGLLSRLLGG